MMLKTFLAKFRRAWKSATVWVNALVVAAMPALDYARANLDQMREYIDADFYKMLGLVVVGLNIALRFRTSKPLEDK